MQAAALSLARDIRPLFRPEGVEDMSAMDGLLHNRADMSDPQNPQNVLDDLNGTQQPQMPPEGPLWSQDRFLLAGRKKAAALNRAAMGFKISEKPVI